MTELSLWIVLTGAMSYSDAHNDASRIEALIRGTDQPVMARLDAVRRNELKDSADEMGTEDTGPQAGVRYTGEQLTAARGLRVLLVTPHSKVRGRLTDVDTKEVTLTIREYGGTAVLTFPRDDVLHVVVQ